MKWLEPVEPLSEARWARVEKKVLDAIDGDVAPAPTSRKKWIALAIVPVAVAAAFALWPKTVREPEGARIVTTDATSRVEIDQSVLDVGPSSAATVTHEPTGVVVKLDRGRVECEVAPRKPGESFIVLAGGVRVRVVGTHFVVARGEETSVDVQRGTVEVTSSGVVATLHAGDHWSTPPVASAATIEAPPPAVSTAERASAESRPRATSAPEISPQREFELAASLEKSDPDRAAATYEKLVKRGGSWGENALYAEGRLEIDRGRVARGRQLLQTYVAQHPQGANAQDARALLERVPF
ncbi:MAG TPA: FecR domain-containing protein [Polyangiaceae bacterium]|jgi:hypothetical protein